MTLIFKPLGMTQTYYGSEARLIPRRVLGYSRGRSNVENADYETEFFLKVVDAQLTFQVDASGKATGIELHQGGRDTPGRKVK